MQKWLFIFIVCFSFPAAVFGQEKHWEHNIYLDIGTAKHFSSENTPFVLHLGYGLSYSFRNHWSLTAGIACRAMLQPDGADGNGSDYDCTYLDLPMVAQYHVPLAGRRGLVFEIGPVFSLCTENGKYDFDANPDDPLQGKPIYKKFDFGLQPAVYYRSGRHWQFGLKGHFGLLNQSRKYGVPTDDYYFRELTVSIGFRL